MRKIEHIEQQIRELSAKEFSELRAWVIELDWDKWDAQIEDDAKSGKLDKLLAEAHEDFASGRSRPI